MKYKRITALLLAALLLAALLAGCAQKQEELTELEDGEVARAGMYLSSSASSSMTLQHDDDAETAAVSSVIVPEATGTIVYGNEKASIDASHTSGGYVMIRYLGVSNSRLKVQIKGPSATTYTYNLNTAGDWEVFPLSDGSGSYKIGVYQNVKDNKYSTLYSTDISVALTDEFAPFLTPNQYVNYTADTKVVKLASSLTEDCKDALESIAAVYNYVVENYSYDTELAATVKSGYLPDLDAVYEKKSGICFDYAATMTAMLRSLGIPTKLVVGYTGSVYHAWINTWSEETGWVDSVIYFDGEQWKLMDPTFASSANSSDSIMQYIGNVENYQAKYLY